MTPYNLSLESWQEYVASGALAALFGVIVGVVLAWRHDDN